MNRHGLRAGRLQGSSSMHTDDLGRPRPATNWTRLSIEILLSVIENFCDFFECIPTARSVWHTDELLDFAEVTDRFHLSTIETHDESGLDGDYVLQPVVIRGEL